MTHPYNSAPCDRKHVVGGVPARPSIGAPVLSSRDGSFHHVTSMPSRDFKSDCDAGPELPLGGVPMPSVADQIAGRADQANAEPRKRRRSVQNRADVKTAALIYDRLKEVLVDNGDGTWSYKKPWDDRSVAIALGTNAASVKYRRQNIFGPEPEPKAVSGNATADRALALIVNLYKLLGQDLPPE